MLGDLGQLRDNDADVPMGFHDGAHRVDIDLQGLSRPEHEGFDQLALVRGLCPANYGPFMFLISDEHWPRQDATKSLNGPIH